MKNILTTLLSILVMMGLTATSAKAQERFVGGDLSMVPAYEQAGDEWLDANGEVIPDLIKYVKEAGWNVIRVRLFVDPTQDNDPSTCQDVSYVKALGKRIKQEGLRLMLDLHYSDTWADPSHQKIPAAWQGMDDAQLGAQLKTYTADVLKDMNDAGATPDFVQIGNEITYGLLWHTADGMYPQTSGEYADAGYCTTWSNNFSAGEKQWYRTAALLEAASEAVRQQTPQAQIIVHTELGSMAYNADHFYRHIEAAGFSDYDIIGLSYYPFWHGKVESLTPLLSQFAKNFPDKMVQIVETAWYNSNYPSDATYSIDALGGKWQANGQGMAKYLHDLAVVLRRSENVNGIIYWAPEECGKGYSQTVWPFNMNRGMWKSSSQKQHSIMKNADDKTVVEALTTFLLDEIPNDDENENNDPTERPTSFTDEQGVTYALYDNFTAGVQSGETAFGEIVIPDVIVVQEEDYTVTSINPNAFFDNKSLSGVTIGRNVKGIWNSAFNGCNALEKVRFAEGSALETIDGWAFSSTAVDSLVIPAGVTVINEGSFNNCWALKHLTLLGDVQEIKQFAFAGWTDEATPTAGRNWSPFSDGVYIYSIEPPVISPKAFCADDVAQATLYVRQQNVESEVFKSIGFAEVLPIEGTSDMFRNVDGVSYLLDPDHQTAVITGLAASGTSMKSITLHPTVTGNDGIAYTVESIKPWAFHQAWNLEEVIIEDGISSIPEGCFAECSNLQLVDIQSTEPVSIDMFAFCKWDEETTQSGCPKLAAVLLHAELDAYHLYAFHEEDASANTTLYVPEALLETFRDNGDLTFKDILPLSDFTAISNTKASAHHRTFKLLRHHRIHIINGEHEFSVNGITEK